MKIAKTISRNLLIGAAWVFGRMAAGFAALARACAAGAESLAGGDE